MRNTPSGFSPDILIFLEVGDAKIRLADLLYDSAMLFEAPALPPLTRATLVISIDGVEDREEIILKNGISRQDARLTFSYTCPQRRLHAPVFPCTFI